MTTAQGLQGVVGFLLLLALYLLPSIIALMRRHHNVGSILVINILLGWTFIGWVAALAMAVSGAQPAARTKVTTSVTIVTPPLSRPEPEPLVLNVTAVEPPPPRRPASLDDRREPRL